MAKLLRYNERWAELEEHAASNPFAVIVMAHLKTKATIRAPESRRQWKMTLVRALYRYGYGREDIQQLFRLIDWMMVLPESEARLFRDEYRQFESETEMPYITSIERMSREEGREEGRGEGETSLLEHLLACRFHELPDWVFQRLKEASREERRRWAERALDASRLEEVFDPH